MNKLDILKIIFIACLVGAAVFSIIYFTNQDIKEVSKCKDLCINKNMEYFSKTFGSGNNIFCRCLNNGIENKFALVSGDEE